MSFMFNCHKVIKAVWVPVMALTAQAADIDALVKEDLKNEVRPGGVNGSPFWNGNSRFFMYPPAPPACLKK